MRGMRAGSSVFPRDSQEIIGGLLRLSRGETIFEGALLSIFERKAGVLGKFKGN